MIATIARLLFAPFKPLFDWADSRCAEMATEALADADACPDEVPVPDEVRAPSTLELCAAIDAWEDMGDDHIGALIEEWSK